MMEEQDYAPIADEQRERSPHRFEPRRNQLPGVDEQGMDVESDEVELMQSYGEVPPWRRGPRDRWLIRADDRGREEHRRRYRERRTTIERDHLSEAREKGRKGGRKVEMTIDLGGPRHTAVRREKPGRCHDLLQHAAAAPEQRWWMLSKKPTKDLVWTQFPKKRSPWRMPGSCGGIFWMTMMKMAGKGILSGYLIDFMKLQSNTLQQK